MKRETSTEERKTAALARLDEARRRTESAYAVQRTAKDERALIDEAVKKESHAEVLAAEDNESVIAFEVRRVIDECEREEGHELARKLDPTVLYETLTLQNEEVARLSRELAEATATRGLFVRGMRQQWSAYAADRAQRALPAPSLLPGYDRGESSDHPIMLADALGKVAAGETVGFRKDRTLQTRMLRREAMECRAEHERRVREEEARHDAARRVREQQRSERDREARQAADEAKREAEKRAAARAETEDLAAAQRARDAALSTP